MGGIAFAQLGDRYGRVRALGWSVVLYSLATAGMALSPNVAVLALMRFVSGIGTGGEWSLGFALVAEVSPRTGRGRLGGMVAGMFNLGTFVAILLFQAKLDWRVAFGVMALPALSVFVLRLTVPESPIWLQLQEARKKGEVTPELDAGYRRPPVSLLFEPGLLATTLKTTLIFTLSTGGCLTLFSACSAARGRWRSSSSPTARAAASWRVYWWYSRPLPPDMASME